MIFESDSASGIGLIAALSELTGSEIKNGQLILPDNFGKGYMKFFDLGPSIKMMLNQSELKEDILLKKNGTQQDKNEITFSFRNVFPGQHGRIFPSVQVSSSDIDLEIFIPAGTAINTILIIIHIDLLKDLLHKETGNLLLQSMLSGNQPYLYDEIVSPEIQHVAAKILEANVPEQLGDFYLRLKVEELIYLFFVELFKRQHTAHYPINVSDVKVMYAIRDKITADFSVPPNLSELTHLSNMSESKMNRLFRQIFGNSIYNYHQALRINEAAYLIRKERFSVSEAGYRLGFTNLSHFTRIFEKHVGLKPKEYSLSTRDK